MDLMEIKSKIHKAGDRRVRVVPMPNQSFNGLHNIEIKEGTTWVPIAGGLSKALAESIVSEATNRTILG